MAIIFNGKDIKPVLNGKPVKQVLYNGKTIYPSEGRCSFTCDDNNSNPEIPIRGDTSWIKGKRCLVKPYQEGVAICYLDENNFWIVLWWNSCSFRWFYGNLNDGYPKLLIRT